jgi:hypothetical protein
VKNASIIRIALAALAIFVTTAAFASSKGSFYLTSPSTIGNIRLPAGEYSVEWTGTEPNLQLKIKREGKLMATVPTKWVRLQDASPYNAAVVDHAEGKSELQQIRFLGKIQALEFEESDMTAGVAVGSGK